MTSKEWALWCEDNLAQTTASDTTPHGERIHSRGERIILARYSTPVSAGGREL